MPNTGQLVNSNIAQKRQGATAPRPSATYRSRLPKQGMTPTSLQRSLAPSPQTYPTIAPVPRRLALAPDRFYIWLLIDFERWAIPIQFTELEARSLLPMIEECRDRNCILAVVECAIGFPAAKLFAGGAS